MKRVKRSMKAWKKCSMQGEWVSFHQHKQLLHLKNWRVHQINQQLHLLPAHKDNRQRFQKKIKLRNKMMKKKLKNDYDDKVIIIPLRY